MTAQERGWIPSEHRATTLVELLRYHAQEHPTRQAYSFLLDGDTQAGSLTYGALDQQARRIAALLQQAQATGARALLQYPPGLDYIAAFFGCLYAGGVAVPTYPPSSSRLKRTDRLQSILRDAQPSVILTTTQSRPLVEPLLAETEARQAIAIHTTDDLDPSLDAAWQVPAVGSDTLAFLQYTSGSTAAPKGVMVTHRNLLHNQHLIQQAFQQSAESVIVGWLPLYHDMGLIGNIMQPLYLGATCILMSPVAFLQQPLRWLSAISRYGATASGGPNFSYELCIRKITPEQRATLDLSSWEVAFNGAEPIRQDTIDRFTAEFAPCGFRREAFFPCYGLAEATLFVAGSTRGQAPVSEAVARAELEQGRIVPGAYDEPGTQVFVSSGHPSLEQEVVIIDPETQQRCPTNRIGEIWVAGPSVAQGYWQRPEATAHTFGAHIADTGAGPYLRTGDLGFIKGGELFIAGRHKDLIIIRGRNHYPQDIEITAERSHPALRAGGGAAFSIDVADEERLVVVQEVERQQRNTPADELVEAVRRAVAEEHEVQVYAVALLKPGGIPKTSSGKIQRQATRDAFLKGALDALSTNTLDQSAPTTASAPLSRESLLAIDPAERPVLLTTYLQQQAARVLSTGTERIAPNLPLVALGLDSLMAIELKHVIEADLGVSVPTVELIESLNIATLTAYVLEQVAAGTSTVEAIPRITESAGNYTLSWEQQRLWLVDQIDPGRSTLNLAVACRLSGQVDMTVLQQSLNTIVQRHATLRTTFSQINGLPTQTIAARMPLPLTLLDLRDAPEAAQEARQLMEDEAQRPFDLQRGPLLRTTLLRTADDEYLLLFAAHHIVCDFWSMTILLHELATLYAAHKTDRRAELPALAAQYPDFVAWQQQTLQGRHVESQLAYWKERLTPLPTPLALPTDHQRGRSQAAGGAHQVFSLAPELTASLQEFSRREGSTMFMTLLAAFNTLLHRTTNQNEITVGSPVSGRNHPDVENLIGFFAYPLVLRTELSGDLSFRDVLARTRTTALEAYAHQEIPFAKVVEVARPARSGRQQPLFQVMFGFLGKPVNQIQADGLHFGTLEIIRGTTDFDLFVTMFKSEDTLHGVIGYNDELFEAETIERLLHAWQATLEQAIARPEASIATLDLPRLPTAAAADADPRQTIAITATFTAEPLEESLSFWLRELDIPARIEFAPYNQVFQQLLDPTSLVGQNERGINVVLLRLEDWQRFDEEGAPTTTHQDLERQAHDLAHALRAAAQRAATPYVLCLCPSAPGTLADTGRVELLDHLEHLIRREISGQQGIYVVTQQDLAATYPVADYADPHADELGHIPYTPLFFSALATMIARRFYSLQSPPHKVIVLDCDQLLWKGVCGEDGPLGVVIDPPRRQLQEFMIAQHHAGMLLCLCSQNNEADVLEVFKQRTDMLLKLEHLVGWRINWQPKSENIRALAEELGLGSDSFIFIDDDPVQCADVQVNCPETLTLQLPTNAEQIPRFLTHVWAFDHLKTTEEDRKRTALYRQNIERERIHSRALTLSDFIASLNLRIEIRALAPDQVARVSQLTYRTNQFNLSTIRRSESEIQQLCLGGGSECFTVQVSDRFGDYGLVGVMIAQAQANALAVDTLLLSCRALGRGVEHAMLRHLGQLAQERSLQYVDLLYVPTKKNQPARDFLERVAATLTQLDGTTIQYRLPAAIAAQMVYQAGPDAEPVPSHPMPTAAATPAGDAILAKSARLTHIGTELYTAEQVLRAVQAQKQAQPDLETLRQAIEAALLGHPVVEQAVVTASQESPTQTIAYIVPDRLHAPTVNGRPRYKLPNNMAIAYQNQYEAFLTYKEIFEDLAYLRHGITINDGDCIVDLGANIGLFTMFVQQLHPHTQVYAFEPAPPVFEALRINTMLYAPNARIFNQGVADATKTAQFTFYPRASAISGYFANEQQDEATTRALMLKRQPDDTSEDTALLEQVDELLAEGFQSQTFTTQLRSLSDIIRDEGIERIDLLKIDVEKSEMDVLNGIHADDWPKIKQMVLEVHQGLLEPVSAILEAQGFQFVVDDESLVQESDFYHMLYAIRPSSMQQREVETARPALSQPDRPLLSAAELRSFLREAVPQAAGRMPTFVLLETLPRTNDGAVDYAALPTPEDIGADEDGFVAPRTPTESGVATIWANLLGLDRVSIRDDFFELGGHSLLATQILAQVREDFDVDLPMKVLFTDTFTVEELAKAIDQYRIEHAEVDDDELSALLKELEGLSDEEIRQRLTDEEI